MSYSTVEAGLLAVILKLANYSSVNASQGDYRILGKGVTRAVVLQPGAIITREVVAAPRRMRTLWAINIELYISFKGELSTSAAAIRTDRQELIDHIDKYPTLDGITDVIFAMIVSGMEPEIRLGENRRWWRQVLFCRVEERATVTIA